MNDAQLYKYRVNNGKVRTLDEVGKKFGLTRQRVCVRLHRYCAAHPELPQATGKFKYYTYDKNTR